VKRAVALAAACVTAAVAAGAAGATSECRGLQVCVPVIGPWVVAPTGAQVSFSLACPRRFVVAGLDAELSRRGVDVTFRGMLGSPVNPGITTSTSAEFLGRQVAAPEAAFRPHIGCIPAAGRGQRFPTAHRPVAPAPALEPTVVQLTVMPGVHRSAARCPTGKRLLGATHAVGFYTAAPPPPSLIAKVHVAQTTLGGVVHVTVRAGALPVVVNAIVQVDLVCA
jgi:hypothetical protein